MSDDDDTSHAAVVARPGGRKRVERAVAWRLVGLDAFSGDDYLVGEYADEAVAVEAGRAYLTRLEREQPSEDSGGQAEGGLQDRVYVVRPDGSRYRLT